MISPSHLHLRYRAACAIAREAGLTARRYFVDRSLTIEFKGPQDFLTEADGAVEKFIASELSRLFPEDGFLGEEGGGKAGDLIWVVDPIDGTANFARALPHFCVSIALIHRNETLLGVIYDPMSDELFSAIRGGGAWLNDRRMHVSTTDQFSHAVFELGWSTRTPHRDYLDMVGRVLNAGASFRRAGSGALALAYVADGRQDGYAELHMNSWDALAGMLMVREAGGWTNDYLAGDALHKGNAVMACNIPLSKQLLAMTGQQS